MKHYAMDAHPTTGTEPPVVSMGQTEHPGEGWHEATTSEVDAYRSWWNVWHDFYEVSRDEAEADRLTIAAHAQTTNSTETE